MSDSEESCTDVESCTSEEFLSSSDDSLFDYFNLKIVYNII